MFFLTIGTRARAGHFRDSAVVGLALSHFLRAAAAEGFAIIAYCFMPDHVHMLVVGQRDDADLRRFVSRAKQGSGFAFARAFGGRLWQVNFFDRTIRGTDDVGEIIAYIVRNPVRARLADNPADYPHWGSQEYSREEILAFVGSARRG